MGASSLRKNHKTVAVTFVIATLLFSCKGDIPIGDSGVESLPDQTVENMALKQHSKGSVVFMVTAPLLERYTEAETPYDLFPKGILLRGYTSEELLETMIVADYARNIKNRGLEGIWEAYGNVVIDNFIKGEKMETDTLYWDRDTHTIYTHRPVKLTTPDMFMQGYGMESDEMARNVKILRPYDSYAIVKRDSLEVPYRDTINFIGPLQRN